jgi:glutamate formiminotransferase/formiminotetrahydrofolate cyclodeaminase
MGAALGTMIGNLSSHKRAWDDRWEEFSKVAEEGKACMDELLFLVDEDTRSFNEIGAAARLPKSTEEEKAARHAAMQVATERAISVPFRVMEVALQAMGPLKAMAEWGLPASASDAGVGALCARTAVMGAYLNVRINVPGLEDKAKVEDFLTRGKEIQDKAMALEKEILDLMEKNL